MTGDRKPRPGGELNAATTRAVVRIHSQYVGRGPTKAQTFHRGPLVVTMMENAMTKAERSLIADGELDVVLGMQRLRRAPPLPMARHRSKLVRRHLGPAGCGVA
jgi:uncharacterized protein YbcI